MNPKYTDQEIFELAIRMAAGYSYDCDDIGYGIRKYTVHLYKCEQAIRSRLNKMVNSKLEY